MKTTAIIVEMLEWPASFTPFSLSRDTALISREDWKIYGSLLVQQDACCGSCTGRGFIYEHANNHSFNLVADVRAGVYHSQ